MKVRPGGAAAVIALGTAPLVLFALTTGPADAHGAMQNPASRVSTCYQEGPEHPRSAACKAAVAASGTQAFYDWNAVNIADAAGRHQEIIPDGKLCSAGREKYRGLDLARADWPATQVSPGPFTFRFTATAPHRGRFDLYISKDGYDPSQALKWSDLSPDPIASADDPQVVDGAYQFEGELPEREGRQLIYAIWQRSDSAEAFYSCSDVDFGGGSGSGHTGGGADGSGADGGGDRGGSAGGSSSAGGPGSGAGTGSGDGCAGTGTGRPSDTSPRHPSDETAPDYPSDQTAPDHPSDETAPDYPSDEQPGYPADPGPDHDHDHAHDHGGHSATDAW
ncbi:lytic polysaccharide monooxygenase [Streptomyces actinomycinicus]|uniref:Lytic polysaccharide monooxygenase n=1 Tax=Streptomyces actinomycinicus TaxID=1695166 RepID=A0A937JRE5_9ACTN|nr:lytic polysaccharide monooxygenase [Streptomyces actinomycinicus]MBL1087685.1 lytic polysaccharide monooxygenase [Streptomyces actinomycinicus]